MSLCTSYRMHSVICLRVAVLCAMSWKYGGSHTHAYDLLQILAWQYLLMDASQDYDYGYGSWIQFECSRLGGLLFRRFQP